MYDRVEILFGWVRELALIWPTNILSTVKEGSAAAIALRLASMYLQNMLGFQKVGFGGAYGRRKCYT